MPLRWCDPEKFLTHNDVTIYHTYKDDLSDVPLEFWYSTCANASAESEFEFDVRELPLAAQLTDADHAVIIRSAIDAGILKQDVAPES